MSDVLKQAMDEMQGRLQDRLREVAELKAAINAIAKQAGMDAPYADAEPEHVRRVADKKLRPDQFYGKSPIVAAREFLEARGQPAAVEEILAGLETGGFDFKAQGWPEKTRLRNLSISHSKNSTIFERLPSGPVGLAKWYPAGKPKRNGRAGDGTSPDAESPAATPTENGGEETTEG